MSNINQVGPEVKKNNSYSPNFTANSRSVRDAIGNVLYLNNSWFFRDDLNWHKFADMLIDKYKDVDKVKIKCAACSEGAEPYSLAMILIEKLGLEKAKKFFPIEASDINEEILTNPKRGILKLSQDDLKSIKKTLKINPDKYMDFDNKFEYSPELKSIVCTGKIKPILQNTVMFKRADVSEVIPTSERNTVFLARNFWIYPKESERAELAQKLYKGLGDNSVCVIGELDNIDVENPTYKTSTYLANAGFKPESLNYCFSKPSGQKASYLSNPEYLKTVYGVSKA